MGSLSDFLEALEESDGGCPEMTVAASEARKDND